MADTGSLFLDVKYLPLYPTSSQCQANFFEASDSKSKELGAQIIAVDYTSADSITHVLETNNIDTLISTLGPMSGADPETALIAAADKSKVTKRYIPSLWGTKYTPE